MSSEQCVEAKKPGQDTNITLKLTDLRLFSYGIYSNVYTGVINEGTPNRQIVAVKKCWSQDEEDLKEIRVLRRLNRFKTKNIVNLLYVFSKHYNDKICFSLVMEFVPMSLSAFIKKHKNRPLDLIKTKIFTWQMFRGLAWMHKNKIFHRDFKPQNILVNPDTLLLQIADFGSSVIIGEYDPMSSYNVTRYYRPPELLLGAHKYGPAIDVWSAGCVFAEMLRGRIFLPGQHTENQLEKILECFGPPSAAQLQAMNARRPKLLEKPGALKAIEVFNSRRGKILSLIPYAPDEALKLVEKIMKYAPKERVCGPKLLANPFFDDIFIPGLQHNGHYLTILTREDFKQAVAGDVPPGGELRDSAESYTTKSSIGSTEPTK